MIHVLYASWQKNGSAEQCVLAEAAMRLQDRADFETQTRLECNIDLAMRRS